MSNSEEKDSRPSILCLFPGPTYDLKEVFGERFSLLSRNFRGYVITSWTQTQSERMGDFDVRAVRASGSTFVRAYRYLSQIAQFVRASRKTGGIKLVVSYDPLVCGLIALAVSRLLRVPFVVEVNGDFAERANYRRSSNRLVQRFRRLRNVWTARFVLTRASAIKLLYPEQLAPLGVDAREQHIGIFPNLTATERFENLGERPEILLAGFPFFVKGVDLLLDAFRRLSSSFPEWELTILGHYPDKSSFDPEALRHPKIRVLDPVTHSEMPAFIGRCAIFALPSRTEAMGRVLLEAMAAGKPRIGTDVGGISRIIEDGTDGILIPPNDVEALTLALRRLMESPETRRRLGAKAAERARIEFSGEAYLRNLTAFYERVIGPAPSAPSPVSRTPNRSPQSGLHTRTHSR
jgi:glycosyltransferase involved in cell wall biosynthesis